MMAKDAHLEFNVDFKSWEVSQVGIPIELRKLDLALVGKTLSTASLDVEPGRYIISTIFPAGQQITQVQEVSTGANNITIKPPPELESPHENHEKVHYFDKSLIPMANVDLGLESMPNPRTGTAFLSFFEGEPLLGTVTKIDSRKFPYVQAGSEFSEFSIPANSINKRFAQLVRSGGTTLNTALPVGPDWGCKLILRPDGDGSYSFSVQLDNLEASLLLRYQEEGIYDQIKTVSRSEKNDPEKLLFLKGADPIAAAVGAYTILKFDQIERLHTWTVNLRDRFPWLADGSAICGEHFARIGNDPWALDSFLQLKERGLPFFSDGLGYALSRLRNYLGNWRQFFGEEGDRAAAENLFVALQQFESFVDFKKPILTFSGRDLSHPDSEIADAQTPAELDLDIKELI